jgi:hypothetical protein
VTSILFDESHGELLRVSEIEDDPEKDTCLSLRGQLKELGFTLADLINEGALTEDALSAHDVLVVAAPTKPFSLIEINAIKDFVAQGKALLIANNSESLWWQNTDSLHVLLSAFGLRTARLLSYPPEEVTTFYPHYLSGSLQRLSVIEPAYLEVAAEVPQTRPQVVAELPWTQQPFLVAVEHHAGRVVALADFVMLGDRLLNVGDNHLFAVNLFHWLTFQNSIDCYDARCEPQIPFGRTATFSIALSNPHPVKLDYVRCTLESAAGARIDQPGQTIRTLPPRSRQLLLWTVEPQTLGPQHLTLTVDFQRRNRFATLVLNPVAAFECAPEARLDLDLLDQDGEPIESVEAGAPFEARATVTWQTGARSVPLQFDLDSDRGHVAIETIDPTRWNVTALDSGDWPITLTLPPTKLHISRSIHARPSARLRITELEHDIVQRLAAEIQPKITCIRREFDADEIKLSPFRLLTPEEHVRELYPADAAAELLEALQAARREQQPNRPLVELLRRNIAPTYAPGRGSLIPFDPGLAKQLSKYNARYEESLASNFLTKEGYDSPWLEQNIAAFLLHEKYGHGFFFTQTLLGRQLALLYRHGFSRKVDADRLPRPYPRLLYDSYARAIQALSDSAMMVNEGLAAWVEIAIAPQLAGVAGQGAFRRRVFLFERDKEMDRLRKQKESHPYFQKYPPFTDSRYQEGHDYLDFIRGYFGADCGPKCAVQAAVKAAEVNLGIVESGGQLQFGLSAQTMADTLLEDSRDDARADMRLRRIHSVLREESKAVREIQKQLQCHRTCLHPECPVNAVIWDKLKW